MTNALRESLARRAHAVEPPALDVHALVSVGERRLRRRRFGAVAGSVLAVALAVGVPAVVWQLGGEPRSIEQPKPPGPPRKVGEPGTRPITYGQGQTLHLGNREIDTELDFLSVAVTDDGAALTTIDGGIWFADGRTVERIGSTIALRVKPRSVSAPAGLPRDWVITDTAGSRLAWMEYPDQRPDRPELVVYDTARRVVLNRKPIEVDDGGSANVLAISGQAVFLGVEEPDSDSVHRYDVDTEMLEHVDRAELAASRRGVSRALIVGSSAEAGGVLHTEGFLADMGVPVSKVTHSGTNSVGRLTVNDGELEDLFDPHTGEPVKLRVPPGYESSQMWFLQWLDDTRFTLISVIPGRYGNWPGGSAPVGDLLVCRITEGRCDVRLDRSTWSTFSEAPLLPGQGISVGADAAMARAQRTVLDGE
jgi:hypothetical protein